MKRRKEFKVQKDSIEEAFEELLNYDLTNYYKNKSTFIELFDDNENPSALNIYLNKLKSKINSALDYALIELREDEETQENFMRWFCERFYLLMNDWVYRYLEELDLPRRKKIIKEGQEIVEVMEKLKHRALNTINEPKGKPFIIPHNFNIIEFLTRKENEENISKLDTLKKLITISEEIRVNVEELLGTDGFSSESPAYFLTRLKDIKRVFSKKYSNDTISVLDPVIGISFSDNQFLVVNFFWSIINRLNSRNTIRGFTPFDVVTDFIKKKIYLRENALEQIDEYDEEWVYELKEEKITRLTANQCLLIIKILGTYDIAKEDLSLNRNNFGILLSALFLFTPNTMKKSLSTFENKMFSLTHQMKEDIDIIRELFCKIGLQKFFEERLIALGVVKQ